ncbi:MAG TPA: acyl-CoA reductase, partial [Candidatus Binatus sp.]|nr:acyl-CoA reductase [Candidatus Binatus sp.]
MADILARAFELWRRSDYARRRVAIDKIARATGYSMATMENSIDALLKPFTPEALRSMAARIASNRRSDKPRTVGFIAAGNVAGAGIHEVALALIAGAGLVIKTASSEPVFFAEFARTIAEIDPHAGARIEVRAWDHSHTELTSTLIAKCELVVVYGDDNTMRALR